MNKLFQDFPYPTKEQWIESLKKELKDRDFEASLIKKDEIENLSYPSFYHPKDSLIKAEIPERYNYKRGFYSEINDWAIVGEILVVDVKQANKKALELLMNGNSALIFEIHEIQDNELNTLFSGIEFQHIKVFFKTSHLPTLNKIKKYFDTHKFSEIYFSYNPLAENKKLSKGDLFSFNKAIVRNFEIDAYSIQQCGANCTQELAFALSLGHEYLVQQVNLGRTIDEALVNIHFTFGIGSNFLFEIAKLRAFRMLWAKIAHSYKPEHKCNETASITSKTGFLNKSLKDPYTNLLRQTTEVMSAVLGGANQIINQAYDKESTKGTSAFAKRMSTNISLILKEESYLHQVLDATGGSYAIESLTEKLADKTWELFQNIEKQGGLFSSDLIQQISETAKKRITFLKENKKTLIGINKFPNPDKSDLVWKDEPKNYFGLNQLVMEKEFFKLMLNGKRIF